MQFSTWLDTYCDEADFDMEQIIFEGESKDGTLHIIELGSLIEVMKTAAPSEKKAIKNTIVKLDFLNVNVKDFFTHLAKGYVASL